MLKNTNHFNLIFKLNRGNKMSIVYSYFVAALAKKGEVIAAELTAEDAHLLHMPLVS